MFKKLWKVTLALTLMCTQVYQGSMSIFAATQSTTTNKTELQEGEVESNKSAKWVDPENGIAEITFDVSGKSKQQAVDIAVVYDNSQSMAEGNKTYQNTPWYQAQVATKTFFSSLISGDNENRIAFIPFSDFLFDNSSAEATDYIKNFWNLHEWLYLKEDGPRGNKGDPDVIAMLDIYSNGATINRVDGSLKEYAIKNILPKYGYTVADIVKKDYKEKDSGLTNDINALNTKIDTLFPSGSTYYEKALAHAQNVLSENNGHKKVILMVSDGIPWDGEASKLKADEIKRSGTTIYTVGVNMSADKAKVLKDIASLDDLDNSLFVETDSDNLTNIFLGIVGDIKAAGMNAQIVDEIKSEYYDYYEDDTYKPMVDGVVVTEPVFTVSNNGLKSTVTWKIGNITETTKTLKFYVKIKDQYKVTDNIYPTNGDATLTFEDYEHNNHTQDMKSPELATQTGTIIKKNYLVNKEGQYLDTNGNVTNNKEEALIKTETFTKQEVGKELTISTSTFDENGKTYVPIESAKKVKLNWSDTDEKSTELVEFHYVVEYPIHFVVRNDVYKTQTGIFGSSMGNAPELFKVGYEFRGWFSETDGKGNAYDINKVVKGEETYYAYLVANSYNYNVDYYLEDALGNYTLSNESYSEKGTFNQNITANDVMKTFTGYEYNVNHKDAISNITVNENNNATLKLYYSLKSYSYSIQYVYDGVNGERTNNLTGKYGETITTFEAKDKNGKYELINTPSVTITNGENIMVVEYRMKEYNVEFKNYDNKEHNKQIVKHGNYAETPTNPERTGYTFTGWKDAKGNTFDPNLPVTSDATYYAQYEINTYSYKVQHYLQNEDGSYTLESEDVPSNKVNYGTTIYDVKYIKDYTNYTFNEQAKDAVRKVKIVDGNAILKLYYDKDKTTYQVYYFFDGIHDVTLNESNTGFIGQIISSYKDKIKVGYHLESAPSITLSANAAENILEVHYAINKYDVSFNDEDGSLIENKEVNHGDKTTAPADPSKDGYHFTGWFDKDGEEFDPNVEVTEDKDYFAKYEINTYSYKVQHYLQNADGSYTMKEEVVPSDKADHGTTLNDVDFVKAYENYHFNKDAKDAVRSVTVMDDNAVLKLYYDINSYNYYIQYVYDGVNGERIDNLTAKYGETITTFDAKDENGKYHLVGTPSVTITDGENIMYVQYEINKYDVNFNDEDGTRIEKKVVNHGDTTTAPADPSKDGYHFTGWFDKDGNAFDPTAEVTENKNYFAKYEINTYRVDFISLRQTVKTDIVNHGDKTSAPADPTRTGFTFRGWVDEYNQPFDPNKAVIADAVYYASYTRNEYAYEVEYYKQNLDGSYFKSTESYTDQGTYGQIVKAEGNIIKEFTGYTYNPANVNAVSEIAVTEDGKATLKLYYDLDTISYQVQYFFDGVLDARLTETGTGYFGQVIDQYTDKVKVGYHLDSAAAITLTADADKNILEVHYVINKYDVNFNDEDGSLIENKEVNHGDTTTAPADPSKDGYHFTGWFDKAGKEFDPTVEVTENKDYFAKYEINTYSYKVQHYLQNADGSYTMKEVVVSMDKVNHGTILHDVNFVKDYANYHFNKDAKDAVRSVTVVDGNAVLKLYYDMDQTTYQVQYFFDGVLDAALTETGTGYVGQVIDQYTDKVKVGYHLDSAAAITLTADADKNILEVHYVINKYDVNFNDEDGTLIENKEVNHGDTTTAPADPSKDGYHFTGWFDKDGKEFDPNVEVTENKNFFAKYEINTYRVDFVDMRQTIKTDIVNHGDKTSAPADPARTGFTFTGWVDEYNQPFDPNKAVTADAVYYASYTRNAYAYDVEYYKQSLDGSYYKSFESYTDQGTYGQIVKAEGNIIKEFTGYTYNPANANAVSKITVTADGKATLKLYYDINSYNYSIQYVYDGVNGERIDNLTAKYGETITTFDAKDENGKYHLAGTPSVTITDGENIMYVHYEINKYDVNFNDEDGSLIENKEVNHGDTTTAPADPSKDGYHFTGWFDKDGNAFDPTAEVTENKDYFANYEINTYSYKVQHYLQNADGSYTMKEEVLSSDKVNHGTTLNDVDFIKTYANYHFNKDAKDAVRSVTVMDGNAVLKLYYDMDQTTYQVQYFFDGVLDAALTETGTGYFGQVIDQYTDKVKVGYHFESAQGITLSTNADENILEVHYAINEYNVYFVVDNVVIKTEIVKYGQDAHQPANPVKDGYIFTGWDKEFTNIKQDTTVYAMFEEEVKPVLYTVNFYTPDGTLLDSQQVEQGKGAVAPSGFQIPEGYIFKGWDKAFDVVNSDLDVYAIYEAIVDPQPETHTVIFLDQNGNEIKRQEVNHGEDATAPVPPVVEGYDFVSWDKDFTNVVTDLVVTAEYKVQQFTVTFVGRDGEIITSQLVDYGKDATAPQAPSYDGYTFIGWDKTFTNVKENLVVTALYEEVITPIDPIDPVDPTDPTDPVNPIDPVIPVTPVVPVPPTPIVVNPTPDTPITPVIPTPTPTPDPTPQPTPTPDPEQGEEIDDNETPLAGPDEDGCWVHWLMLLLTIIYAIYAAIRIFFRANNNSNLKDDRKDLEEEIENFKKGAQAA